MLKFDLEDNWANNLLSLRKPNNLPLNDENVIKIKMEDRKLLLKTPSEGKHSYSQRPSVWQTERHAICDMID